MSQNIYDDEGFFAGYAKLPRSTGGLDNAPEWPTIRAMLGEVTGRDVVDLGCGFGWFCRWVAGQGAREVLGLDLSEKMLERARSDTPDPRIRYEVADLERLVLPEGGFDLAYSSLAFHYVDDAGKLFGTIFRSLRPAGRLVFSTEHPIYMAPTSPAWMSDASGKRIWPLDRYALEGQRVTDWLAPGVIKYHRRLATTLNLLIGTGFVIEHVEEFHPSPEQIENRSALAEELDRPMFLMVRAARP